MQEFTFRPQGVCSSRIRLRIADGILAGVEFEGGCDGNLEGLSRLVVGMPASEVIRRLQGIRCGRKSTSCPDQLSKALAQIQAENGIEDGKCDSFRSDARQQSTKAV